MTTTCDDVVEVLEDGPWCMTAAEIADELGVSRTTIGRRLEELDDPQDVQSRKVGSRAVAWQLTNDETRVTPDGEDTDTDQSVDVDPSAITNGDTALQPFLNALEDGDNRKIAEDLSHMIDTPVGMPDIGVIYDSGTIDNR